MQTLLPIYGFLVINAKFIKYRRDPKTIRRLINKALPTPHAKVQAATRPEGPVFVDNSGAWRLLGETKNMALSLPLFRQLVIFPLAEYNLSLLFIQTGNMQP